MISWRQLVKISSQIYTCSVLRSQYLPVAGLGLHEYQAWCAIWLRPQIIYLTFDDGISKLYDDQYFSRLFMADASGNYIKVRFMISWRQFFKISSQIYPNGPDLLLRD